MINQVIWRLTVCRRSFWITLLIVSNIQVVTKCGQQYFSCKSVRQGLLNSRQILCSALALYVTMFVCMYIYMFIATTQPKATTKQFRLGRYYYRKKNRHHHRFYIKNIKTALIEHKTTQVRLRYYNRKKNHRRRHRRGLYKKNIKTALIEHKTT